MKSSEFRKLIREEVRKVIKESKKPLKEYLINIHSTIEDVGGLNVLQDMADDIAEDWAEGDFSKNLQARYKPIANKLWKELKPFAKRTVPAKFVDDLDGSWYDGSDAYDDIEMQEEHLPKIYDNQIRILTKLIKYLKTAAGTASGLPKK